MPEECSDSEKIEFYLNTLRSLCYNPACEPPVAIIMELLTDNDSTSIRWIASEKLSSLSKSDDGNTLASFIGQLLSEASSAYKVGDSRTAMFLAQTLCNLCLKEMNKSRVLKFGGAVFFVNILADSKNSSIDNKEKTNLERSYSEESTIAQKEIQSPTLINQ